MGSIGRYEIVKHLASGGMAEVLLARSKGIEGFERYVVVKRIHANQARDAQFVKMFIDEARLAASLHHQNIVQVHEIGEEAGEYFFTMEYLHGQDLHKVLRALTKLKEAMPLTHIATVVIGAAAGLHCAHEQRGPDRQPLGIVHRDVSLSNIMVGYDGSVKVTDFGIAKAALRSAETRSGALKGKVAYMSPEQCTGKSVDRRSDVYALGIVLYELVTGRRLFKAETDYMTMSAIVEGRIPSPTVLRSDLPPALEAIILKALARQPSARYQSAAQLGAAVEQWTIDDRVRTSQTALSEYMTKLFGDPMEPWRIEGDVVPDDDDDGQIGSASGSGVASVPSQVDDIVMIADPRSPIAKARTKAITGSPPSSVDLEALDLAPPRRRWMWVVGGIGAASAVAIVVALASGGGGGHADAAPAGSAKPATDTAAGSSKPATDTAAGSAAGTAAANDTAAGSAKPVIDTAAGSAKPVIDTAAGSATPPGDGTIKTVKKPEPVRTVKKTEPVKKDPKVTPTWDPDSLFIKKKPK